MKLKEPNRYKYDFFDLLKSIEDYNSLIQLQFTNVISTIKLIVTDYDYELGYITRYFFKQKNVSNSVIVESLKKDWSKSKFNPLYNNISIDWRIIGKQSVIEEENLKTIIEADKIMLGIKHLLEKNLLEYVKL